MAKKFSTAGIQLVILFIILTIPMLQHRFMIVESGKLHGDVRKAPDTPFTLKRWWDGTYQGAMTAHANDNVGFREDLVRVNNQLNFSLFRKLSARNVVMGPEQYLFEDVYIKAYCGEDFAGGIALREKMRKLKFIQDTLERQGTQLMVVFAPSKARFFPEYFPAHMRCPVPGRTNYGELLRACSTGGVPYVDVNGWFAALRPTAAHPIFSKQGIHWSHYGAALAADSINRVMGELLGYPLRAPVWEAVNCTDKPLKGDDDIALGLNLIWPVTQERLCYPALRYPPDSIGRRPDVIYISDSFFWTLLDEYMPQQSYRRWQFWYYFNEMWTQDAMHGHIADSDWFPELAKTDMIVLLFSEPQLTNLGNGFIEAAYEKYGGR